MITDSQGLSYHQWFIEFDKMPNNLHKFASHIDTLLQQQNSYYADLLQGNILQTLRIVPLQKGAFQQYMKSIGKLGGQNKVPRLSNNRVIADSLLAYAIKK